MAAPLLAAQGVTTGSAPRADVRDLHVTFQRNAHSVHALRGVSLDIQPGEILSLVGESGSGKSVLGLSLLGLLPLGQGDTVSGSVEVAGTDMVSADEDQRRRVRGRYLGAVFQDPMTSLNPTMRIGDQVREAAGSAEEAVRLLTLVGFPEPSRRLRAFPHELSGGLRQRVMIAMALGGNPELLIADEPTTALDVTVQAQIMALIRDLRDELGMSVLMISHDLGLAATVADRVAVLYAGRIAEIGQASAIIDSPEHPYTAGLLASRLSLQAPRVFPVPTLAGEPPDMRDPPPGCPFAPRCPFAIPACTDGIPVQMARRDGHGTVACIRATEVDATAAVVITRPAREDPAPARTRESSQPVLIARNVSKTFEAGNGLLRRAKLHALVDVSLELEPGEAVAVVGESGSGKSTLLRLIAGLERPDGGEIDVRAGGRPQMVFQDAGSSLTPWLRVADQVGERLATGGKRKRVDARAAAGEALRAVGLPSAADAALPRALSGGQRQRAALARATLVPPSVLLCDEPTSALDASLAGAILNLLADMRTQLGVALVFVTHDLGIARLIADRILVMYLGRIVEEGPTDEVIQNPAHPYTRALLAAHEEVGSRLVQGEPASPLSVPAGCAFHPRCPVADDVCMSDRPPLAEVRPSRNAACWHPFEADAVGRGSE